MNFRPGFRPVATWLAVCSLTMLCLVPAAHARPRGLRRPRPSTAGGPRAADRFGRPDPLACKPTKETLRYHGGDLVEHPDVFLLFWGPKWVSDAEHLATKAALVDFFTDVGGSGFACAWREYAVLGHPLGAGTFNGSHVLASAPPNPLSDGDIQAEIENQIALGHAPVRTDDRVYIVVSQKDVVVDDGTGETGCGGANFTFCGYHADFGSLGARYRYAVLPYPCNSGGFTCFIGATDDPQAALQSVGAHELTELVTDPDSDTLGGSGWYSDRTGNENADICAADACTDTLAVGANSYPVNPAWSNLAQGCITDVPCTVVPECNDAAPGLCTPTKNRITRCAYEWLVDPNLTLQKGLPTEKVSCTDGQPFCDFDGAANGACTFHVAACLNSSDPRVTCSALPINSIQLAKPKPTSLDPIDATNATTLLGGLQSADANSAGAVFAGTIAYTPAATTTDSCTSFLDLTVPVGKRTFALKAISGRTKIPGRLTLICRP